MRKIELIENGSKHTLWCFNCNQQTTFTYDARTYPPLICDRCASQEGSKTNATTKTKAKTTNKTETKTANGEE